MKAIRIHKYGGPRVLTYEEAPQPEPKEDELLIRVHATSVNPADWQICSGQRWKLKKPFSVILGLDVSGVVEAVGGGVTDFKPGDEVFGMTDIRKGGAYAEYVAAPARNFACKPRSLDHIQAAAVPLVSLTAWQALFEAAKLSAGQRILIHGAAGGVGHIAVQLAKWKGAYVLGPASDRNVHFLRESCVEELVNYRVTRFERTVRDVDVVLETINRDINVEPFPGETLQRSWGILKKNGVLVSICVCPSPETAAVYGVRAEHILVQPDAAQLSEIAKLVDAGHVKPTVETVLPLKEARQAHELSQKGHTRGKIVLQVL